MKKFTVIDNDNYIAQVLIHIALGVVLYLFMPFSKLYFIVVFVYFLSKIILAHESKKTQEVLFACAYITGAEVLFRMTKGAISYEVSKYSVILFVLLGIFFKGINFKAYPYFLYLIALVPAIIVASKTLGYQSDFRRSIAFVLSGPVCLGLAALFLYNRKVSIKTLINSLLYLVLPAISMTVYLFLYNPSIKDTLSGTASNASASGGFGPNQVSTALGLGMFAIVVRLFLKSPSLTLKILNALILGGMTYRAFATFSRGGVYAAVIVIAAFLGTLFLDSSKRQKNQIIGSFLLLTFAAITTWVVSSNQTSGLINKRYANQDSLGRDKGDLTTGRLGLFMEEMDGFLDSPFFGVGASRVKDMRLEEKGIKVPSHNEIGRLLSEHGILGIFIITILIIVPLVYRGKNKSNYFFYAFLAFWFATINHSGMRIAAPSFLYALSLIHVTYEKRPIHRKQLKE